MPPLDAADLSDSDHLLERLSVERCTGGAVLRLMDEHGIHEELPLPSEVLAVVRRVIATMADNLAISLGRLSSLTSFDGAIQIAGVSEKFLTEGIEAGHIGCEHIGDQQYIDFPSVLRLKGHDDSVFLPPERKTDIASPLWDLLNRKDRPVDAAILVAGEPVPLPSEVLDAARFVTKVLLSGEALQHSTMPLEITEEQATEILGSHLAFLVTELEEGRLKYVECDGQRWVDLRNVLELSKELFVKTGQMLERISEVESSPGAPVPTRVEAPVVD